MGRYRRLSCLLIACVAMTADAASTSKERAWAAATESGAVVIVKFDESSELAASVYRVTRILLRDKPVHQWTFMWLVLDNEKGEKEFDFHPSLNSFYLVWKDKRGNLRQAKSEDISLDMVFAAIDLGVRNDPATRRMLEMFESSEVMPGVSLLKVVVFKTDAPIAASEVQRVYAEMELFSEKTVMTEVKPD